MAAELQEEEEDLQEKVELEEHIDVSSPVEDPDLLLGISSGDKPGFPEYGRPAQAARHIAHHGGGQPVGAPTQAAAWSPDAFEQTQELEEELQEEKLEEHIDVSSPTRIGVKGDGHQRELAARVSRDSDENTLQLGYATPKSLDGIDGLSDDLASPDKNKRTLSELYSDLVGPPGSYFDVDILEAKVMPAKRAK